MKQVWLALWATILIVGGIAMADAETVENTAAGPADCQWKEVDGVRLPVPPSEHPRLYLRTRDLDDFRRRYNHPTIQNLIREVTDDPEKFLAGRPSHSGKSRVNLDRYLLNTDLLKYMAGARDEKTARELGARGLELLKACPDKKKFKGGKTPYSRQTGRMICTAAAAYDWCHATLTDDMKNAYYEHFMRLMRQMEVGFPPDGPSVVGHSCEADIQRDQLSVAVALYDEHPEIYDTVAGRIFKLFVPVRNWFLPYGAHHQGNGYVNARFGPTVYTQWIFARMGAGLIYKDMPKVHHYYLHKLRPDGLMLSDGDGNRFRGHIGEKPRAHDSLRFLAALYRDGYLQKRAERFSRPDFFFNALFADPFLESRDYDDLPLSYYAGGPFGRMVARTGWGNDAAICEMRVNEYYFGNHQHLDGGSFLIYYKGSLASDSGIYQGIHGKYWSDHNKNWAWRTIAHNAITVYDPDEKLVEGYVPDGGQWVWNDQKRIANSYHMEDLLRDFHMADVTGHGFGPDSHAPDYSYVRGDLTRGYGKKVESLQRGFVFLNLKRKDVPAALVVYDDVVSAKSGFVKTWRLHSHTEPAILKNGARVDRVIGGECNGRLVLQTLLPAAPRIEKIGGPGKEFYHHGTNWIQGYDKSHPDYDRAEYGGWRVEVSPEKAAKRDEFLNVMQVTDADNDELLPVDRILTDRFAGVAIADRVVMMARGVKAMSEGDTFEIPRKAKVLVTGLASGAWTVETAKGKIALKASEDAGLLWFEAPEGACRLTRQF